MKKQQIFSFNDSDEAKNEIELMLREGDVVLIKGSQSIRTEKIVEEIMRHPDKKEKLLVRQDSEWLNR